MNVKVGILRKGVAPRDSIQEDASFSVGCKTLDDGRVVWFTTSHSAPTYEDMYFFAELGIEIDKSLWARGKTGVKIAIFVPFLDHTSNPAYSRWFLIGFNDCRPIIRSHLFESKAMAKIAVNHLLSTGIKPEFKSVDVSDYGNKQRKLVENVLPTSNLWELGVTPDYAEIRNISLIAELDGVRQRIELGRFASLKFSSGLASISSFLLTLVSTNYSKKLYEEDYSYLDYNKEVTDKRILDDLERSLIAKMSEQPEDIHFSWPYWITDEFDKFEFREKYGREGSCDSSVLDDYFLNDIIGTCASVQGVLESTICATSNSDNVIQKEPFRAVIQTEVELGSKKYVLYEGTWIELHSGLVNRVQNFCNKVAEFHTKSSLLIPEWRRGQTESDYNKEAALLNGAENIDMKFLRFSSRGKLEIGDILFQKENTVFAIKRLHSSQSVSHLVSQVTNAREALIENSKDANSQLLGSKYDFSKIVEIVMGIAYKHDASFERLPFFSKVLLMKVLQNNSARIPFKITFIPYGKPV